MRIRRSFVIKVSIVFILVLACVYAVNYFKENAVVLNTPEEHFPKLYNASRYFFRVGHPEDWDDESGAYGFMLDEATGHVFNLFPLIKSPAATAVPTAQPGSTPLPEPMERDDTCTVSFYYFPFDKEAEFDLADLINSEIEKLLSSDKGITEDDIGTVTEITTQKGVTFKTFTYTYKPGSFPYKGEMYVAMRSMAYYIIIFEAEHDTLGGSSYNKYKDTVHEIIEDFRFSVFDH